MASGSVVVNSNPKWWKEATVYQIYPASYKDSNDDGVGDLRGIISKLDYIKDIGVDVIWLSPMYDSPQEDMGYDISNYEAIYPKYGTMEDMDELILQVHKRGMKILVDLVINHCSSEHEWFKESRSSKTNAKRDWFWWRPAKYDAEGNRHPPNNWASFFGGSAWTWDELTQEYYLRLFAEGQPDFNWENEETRKLIYNTAVKFWLKKGCDGFRIDVISLYSKVTDLPDLPIVNPDSEWQPSLKYTLNGPRIHEFVKEMNRECFTGYDIMTVGEVMHGDIEDVKKYTGESQGEIGMMFLFDLVSLGQGKSYRCLLEDFKLIDFKKAVKKSFEFVDTSDSWATAFIENHDQARSISRFGDDSSQYRVISGKLLSLMETTLTGTLFVYQGQEIGMTNIRDKPIEFYKDIETLNPYKELLHKNDAEILQRYMKGVETVSRDQARLPFQWDDSQFGGFSKSEPWMGVNDNYKEVNASSQVDDPNSLLSFWKKSLLLRKRFKDIFVYGFNFKIYNVEDENLFIYSKQGKHGEFIYVVSNFSKDKQPFVKHMNGQHELINNNYDDADNHSNVLRAWEGRVYLVTSS